MNGINIKEIIKDIESLTIIVNFGQEKLQDFFAQIAQKEQRLMAISSRELLSKFLEDLQALRGSLQVTGDSLKEWKEKAAYYLHQLHEIVKHHQEDATSSQYNFRQIADSTTDLLQKITLQLQHIRHQNDKLASLAHSVQSKKSHLPITSDRRRFLKIKTEILEKEVMLEVV